jgi:sulfopyruvate decarboxylase beta subunit
MPTAEEQLIEILRNAGVDLVATLPCARVQRLLRQLPGQFEHLALSREEEGVGIAAGAALAGRRPAMIGQNSSVGNLLNALLSLTAFYELPLALFLSHRGLDGEPIAAQVPMGQHVQGVLEAAGVTCTRVDCANHLPRVAAPLARVYAEGRIHAFLLHPRVWEDPSAAEPPPAEPARPAPRTALRAVPETPAPPVARLTRYELLEAAAPHLAGHPVICNLGAPAKELYAASHQDANFYMLGSMGMATPIGLGVALSSRRRVHVIDGDGSLLMNPSTLALVAAHAPDNLTILAIDNGVYGSTGDQPTHAATVASLSALARAFGLQDVRTVAAPDDLAVALRPGPDPGPRFVHALALPGNRPLPDVPLTAAAIKAAFMAALR